MSRNWSASALAALASSNVPLLMFIQCDFSSGTLRLCTAAYDVTWDTQVWTGAGALLSVSPVEEKTSVEATGLNITMSAVNSSLLALAYAAQYQGRRFQMWAAPLTEALQVIEARRIYVGYMDTMTIDDSSGAITLQVEHILSRLRRAQGGNYNYVDQTARYPGDKGLEYIASLEKDTEIKWGPVSD